MRKSNDPIRSLVFVNSTIMICQNSLLIKNEENVNGTEFSPAAKI